MRPFDRAQGRRVAVPSTVLRTGAVVALAALAGIALAQDPPKEKIALKLSRRPQAGDRMKVLEDIQESRRYGVKEEGKPAKVEDDAEERLLEYEREIIALEKDIVVAKERRTFSKFKIRRGKAPSVEEDKSLEGKTVVIVRGSGGNDATIEGGGSPGALALDYLATEKERELERVLPDNPFAPPEKLAPGETWKFDVKKLLESMGSPFSDMHYDAEKSQAQGKLKRVFEKNGARYAEFGVVTNLKCKGMAGAEFVDGGALVVEGEFEACIDGTRPDWALNLSHTFAGKLRTEGADNKGTQEVDLAFTLKARERRELLPAQEPASKPAGK